MERINQTENIYKIYKGFLMLFMIPFLASHLSCTTNYNDITETFKTLSIERVSRSIESNSLPNNDETVKFNGVEYSLTFYDNFNGDELDTTKWNYKEQHYNKGYDCDWTRDAVKVENGNLIITASKHDKCKWNKEKCDYQTGCIMTGPLNKDDLYEEPKFSQRFGAYEFRFKITKTSGLWYAFWLLDRKQGKSLSVIGDKGAEDGCEIDMLEILPKPNSLYSTIHWDGYGKNHRSKTCKTFLDDSFYNEYHTCVFLWTEEGYRLYIDNYLMTALQASDCGGVSNEPAYILISSEFGSWGGAINEDELPRTMTIDYIKAYKKID